MTEPDDQEPESPKRRSSPLFRSTSDEIESERTGKRLLIGLAVVAALAGATYLIRSRRPEPPPAPSAKLRPPPPPLAEGITVHVEAGTFKMGAEDGDDDEKPLHEVKVAAFDIDLAEVTVAAYARCVEAGKCTEPKRGGACNWKADGRERHPINCVDFQQATSYCASVGKRLPTEEEWEYAARGPASKPRAYGDGEPRDQLCWNGEGNDLGRGERRSTCIVGSYPKALSAFGALDMAGNVWEWTSSAHCPYAAAGAPSAACDDPHKVVRGGAWNNSGAKYVRAADRAVELPAARQDNVGIRCAR